MTIRPQRILWPTDFSPLSLWGARYARAFRETLGAELHVIHVIPPSLTPDFAVTLPTEVPVTYSEDELARSCRTRLDELLPAQFGTSSGIVAEVLFGNPWSAICKYAADATIDLIIVATHGRTGLQHVLIGSTAERIVQNAPCPVLTVKRSGRDFVVE